MNQRASTSGEGRRSRARAAALLLLLMAVREARADPLPDAALAPRQSRIYQQVCAQCHTRPGIGVPLAGDTEAWRERAARGIEALVASSVAGIRGMPPLGTCGFCSEEDLRVLAAFLAGLPLPPAPGEAEP